MGKEGSEYLKSVEVRDSKERTRKVEEMSGGGWRFRRRYFHGDLDLRWTADHRTEVEYGRAVDRAGQRGRGWKGSGMRSKVST